MDYPTRANVLSCAKFGYNLLAVILRRAAAMNFNIYLDNALGAALARLAKRRKVARNALIRQAVEDLLAKESRSEAWSDAVLSWQGEPDFPPFESQRSKLMSPAEDPLA
jgi:predicted transcriptional regulator